MPTNEELIREQDLFFDLLMKSLSAKGGRYELMWKKKEVRMLMFCLMIKNAAATNSKRNLAVFNQYFNRWFTQDSSGNTELDLKVTKLEYWEMLMIYLVWKRFMCVEPLEDFKGAETKDALNFEPYIYWDVSSTDPDQSKNYDQALTGS